MTCRLNFSKRVRKNDGSSEAYQATASMTQPGALVQRQSSTRRASRFGPAARNLAACGRTSPLRPNLRRAWGRGHAPREVAWLLSPPRFEGRRLWWMPGCVVRVVGR